MKFSKVTPQPPIENKDSSAEHAIRIQKVQELRKLGVEPWPPSEPVTATCTQVIEEFNQGNEGHSYAVAGRIMTKRGHGKTIFAHIQDRSGKLQIYLKLDQIGQEQFSLFDRDIDGGDIIWCEGTTFKTKTGEITLSVIRFKLLSKCLHPLPEKFHGITDIETKYRHRYLDLMTNEETRERFKRRTALIKSVRDYLDRHDFLEVETPMLHPIPGGAAARPFITHHNALDSDFYLRIAPELYLKKLVVGGFERVYEINRNFRNEGISTRHNPEFTMLEFYMAYQDYHFIMQFVETMLREMVQKTCGTLQVHFGEYVLDFSQPFKRINAQQALIEYAKLTQEQLTVNAIDQTLKRYEIILENKQASHGQKIFALFEKLVEKSLVQPTFIIDFPSKFRHYQNVILIIRRLPPALNCLLPVWKLVTVLMSSMTPLIKQSALKNKYVRMQLVIVKQCITMLIIFMRWNMAYRQPLVSALVLIA